MPDTQNLPRNTIFSGLSAISNAFLLALVILAGRILGDAQYGKFSLALAVASIFEMPIDFGLNTLAVKSVARDRGLASRYLHAMIPWKLILSLAVMLLLIPVSLVLTRTWDARIAIYAMGLAIVLRTFKSTTHAFFRAYERFDLVLLTTYTERLTVALVCGFILLQSKALIPFAFAFALARTPDLVYSFWLLHRKIVRLGWSPEAAVIRDIQKKALPFGSLNIITVMYAYVGTVILGAFRPPEEIGWYGAGYRVYEGLTMFPFILSTVLLPRLSGLYMTDRSEYSDLSVRSLKYVFTLGLPVVVIGWHVSPWILGSVFGADYVQGAPALRVLFMTSAFMFANLLLNTILVSADKQVSVLRVSISGLLLSVLGHLALVPFKGLLGAAIAALAAEVCVFLMYSRLAHREALAIPVHRGLWRVAVAGTVSWAATMWPGLHGTAAQIPIFAGVYILCILALGTFDRKEILALKKVFRSSPSP